MNIGRDEQITEAERRMEILEIPEGIRRKFFDDGELSFSSMPAGEIFPMDEKDMGAIREFEEKNHALVYFVIRSAIDDMMLDALLYVSRYPAEWSQDREDLRNGGAISRVLNRDYPQFSDSGYIEFEHGSSEGLIRTA